VKKATRATPAHRVKKGDKGDTGAQGEKGDKGDTGAQGERGSDGHTPVKGVDYFTDADIADVTAKVEEAVKPELEEKADKADTYTKTEVDNVLKQKASASAAKIYSYAGEDLSKKYTAEELHNLVAAGDFADIEIGDYYPITLDGTFKDFAKFTIPAGTEYYSDTGLTTSAGTTTSAISGDYQSATAVKFTSNSVTYYVPYDSCSVGYAKSIKATVNLEVAAINPYIHTGDVELSVPHVVLVSRDCLPGMYQMRCADSVWYDSSQKNPWLGSALYATLNDPDSGIVKLVEDTDIGKYIYAGKNGKGMRAILPDMAAGKGSPTGWTWYDRGKLFLLTERESHGSAIWQTSSFSGGIEYNQWPIFAGSSKHIIKRNGDKGSRASWWLESAVSTTAFSVTYGDGNSTRDLASHQWVSLLLCFLLA
jgi:hypothetical protein